jgi:hypothetical protein
VKVVLDQAVGNYPGALAQRNNIIRLIVRDVRSTAVKLNGLSCLGKIRRILSRQLTVAGSMLDAIWC